MARKSLHIQGWKRPSGSRLSLDGRSTDSPRWVGVGVAGRSKKRKNRGARGVRRIHVAAVQSKRRSRDRIVKAIGCHQFGPHPDDLDVDS